ncbi:MAG: ABC transporter ATP-binding protein [Candidatus Bathyarchaeia archaeon]
MPFFRRLSGYIVRNWLPLILAVTCMVITTYLNIYTPFLMQEIIDGLSGASVAFNELMFLALEILMLTGIAGIFSFIQRYANAYFSQKIVYDVRNDVFASLQRQSFAFYDKAQVGQLMSKATTDVDRISMFLGWQFTGFVSSLLLLGGTFLAMLSINLELTLISFTIAPFIFLVVYRFGSLIRPITRTVRDKYGVLTSTLWENLTGIRVVRAFAREKFEREKFHKINKEYLDLTLTRVKIRSFYTPLITLLTGVGTILILWYGGLLYMSRQLTVGELARFNVYLGMLLRPMWLFGMMWGGYQQMAAAGERVFEIIDATPEIKDKPGAIDLSAIQGHIRFNDVSFGYDKDRLILKNLNLEAKPGETVALLGPTGSGKSTIIRLLPRFYDVTSGSITIDGYDIRDVKLSSLRRQIGIVAQETFLFGTTVKENIAYGKPDATMDEIIEAARIAKAHDFIMALPKGYETMVGERGVTLSGGQQQRIAIARALLMNPKILILDDSTSSVDVDTEYEIQQALKALLKDRTTFMITQRVSTIRNADKIVVLENGEIAEEGTHETLMAKKGAYYQIYQTLYEAQQPIVTSKVHPVKQAETEMQEGKK